jgi:thiol:disulfide interchange protein DsbD
MGAGVVALLGIGCAHAFAQPVKTEHVEAELVPEHSALVPGTTTTVALRLRIQDGWHTYWRNPGDSGEPTQIKWTLPAGWTASEIIWPAPSKQPTGPLMNYGYSDEVLLPVAITAPATARPGEAVTLKADAAFLVCADICVPEAATLQLSLPVGAAPAGPDPKWAGAVEKALASAPRPAGLSAAIEKPGAGVALAIAGEPLKGADVADAYFFPYSPTLIEHAQPQTIDRGPDGLTLTLVPGYDFQGGQSPSEIAGVLAVGGKAYEVTAAPGPLPAAAAGLGPPSQAAGGSSGGLGLAPAAQPASAPESSAVQPPSTIPTTAMTVVAS